LQTADFTHACKGTPHVRNGDRARQRSGANVEPASITSSRFPPFFAAADQVVSDAGRSSQRKHRGGDQPEQFLCFGAERAGFVGLGGRGSGKKKKHALMAEVGRSRGFSSLRSGAKFFENLPGDRPWFLRGDIFQRNPTVPLLWTNYGPIADHQDSKEERRETSLLPSRFTFVSCLIDQAPRQQW